MKIRDLEAELARAVERIDWLQRRIVSLDRMNTDNLSLMGTLHNRLRRLRRRVFLLENPKPEPKKRPRHKDGY